MLSEGTNECSPYDEWYPLNTHFGQYGHTKLEICFVFLYFEKTGSAGWCDPNPNDFAVACAPTYLCHYTVIKHSFGHVPTVHLLPTLHLLR